MQEEIRQQRMHLLLELEVCLLAWRRELAQRRERQLKHRKQPRVAKADRCLQTALHSSMYVLHLRDGD